MNQQRPIHAQAHAAVGRGPVRRVDASHFASGRSAEEFARAARHTRRVRFLKRALPFGGGAAIIILIGAYLISQFTLPKIDPGEARVVDGKLVMNNPKITGTDGNQRPYTLSAERAVQDAQKPEVVTLEKISGKLAVDDVNFANVIAGSGIYDTKDKTIVLRDDVKVDTDDGMAIRLKGAAIDIEAGVLSSSEPVSIDTGRAKITAQSVVVSDKGKRIVFENRVKMILQPIDPTNASDMRGSAQ